MTHHDEHADQITIYFNRRPIPALANDTVASALFRNGVRIFSRSFKYHRPRGLLCCSGRCPNCLMNIDGVPNARACITPVSDNMRVRHQNANPDPDRDWLSIADHLGAFMPVGFYYKIFTQRWMWHAVEPMIRKVAGLGEIEHGSENAHGYEHLYLHADVAVIGAGPTGIQAAIEAAATGERVSLFEAEHDLGGGARYQRKSEGDVNDVCDLIEQVRKLENLKIFTDATCFGLYEGNLLGIVHRTHHSERLIHLRARRIIVATGAYEVPIVFENNDLPGVMLSTGVQRLLTANGIKPADRAVVIASNGGGNEVISDLRAADVDVIGTVSPDQVIAAVGHKCVTGLRTTQDRLSCDLIVVCGPRVPDAGLIAQAGGKLEWSADLGAFVPAQLPSHISVVGNVTGKELRRNAPVLSGKNARSGTDRPIRSRSFVCYCEDVTTKDLCQAIAEGFDHIETLKRYSTVTMGPCQGKMCQLASIVSCAAETGRAIGDTGTTTSRPPTTPVSLGALAGSRHHPVRRTPLHRKHEERGAVWMDMGEWKRPLFYFEKGGGDRNFILEEYTAVRERVGMIDVSTLGKLDLKGKDVAKLLDKAYANRLSDLRDGRVRYSVICDDSGVMLDDGTISRLAQCHFFITTTTGNLEFVHQWLDWWTVGTGWCVHATNVTAGLCSINVAGPKARDTLIKLTDCDLGAKSFPYMACRQARVAGVPCVLLRIGFVGETGWEIHFPAEYGEHLWDEVMTAGRDYDIRTFGVEAQRLLRLEKKHAIVGVDTDATSNPLEADMSWVVKVDKEDFIGKSAILRMQHRKPRQQLVGFIMEDDVVPSDGAAVTMHGLPVGRVTSARFSPAQGRGIGLAWVPAGCARPGEVIQIKVNDLIVRARVTRDPFYDPSGTRLRM